MDGLRIFLSLEMYESGISFFYVAHIGWLTLPRSFSNKLVKCAQLYAKALVHHAGYINTLSWSYLLQAFKIRIKYKSFMVENNLKYNTIQYELNTAQNRKSLYFS